MSKFSKFGKKISQICQLSLSFKNSIDRLLRQMLRASNTKPTDGIIIVA